MPWTAHARLALIALAMVMAPGLVSAQMLAAIPVETATGVPAEPSATPSDDVLVRVHVVDSAGLARLLGMAPGEARAAGTLELRLTPGTHPEVGSPPNPEGASFIVDFDDPAVVQLRQRMLDAHGQAAIGGEMVVAFVARAMQPEFAAHAHLASQVARELKGDCTEHALLTAALARSVRIPARIVQGAVLMNADGRWQAYGHAWVQTFEAGRWLVRDSALADFRGPVHYLPAFVVADEGPGYKLGMVLGFNRMPRRIEILGRGGTSPVR
jgi:hypothetical protein